MFYRGLNLFIVLSIFIIQSCSEIADGDDPLSNTQDEDASVSISADLSLADSEDDSLQMNEKKYILGLLNLTVGENKSCTIELNDSMEGNIDCPGFKGSLFAVNLFEQGPNGLILKGVATSDQSKNPDDEQPNSLSVHQDTDQLNLSLLFDPATDTFAIKGLVQKDKEGQPSKIKEMIIPPEIAQLNIPTGEYTFCREDLDHQDKNINELERKDIDSIEACNGEIKKYYLRFIDSKPGVRLPRVGVWNKKEAYDQCKTGFHISDGINQLQFTRKEGIELEEIFDKMISANWLPDKSKQYYEYSLKNKNTSNKEMLDAFNSLDGEGSACEKAVKQRIVETYKKTKNCNNIEYNIGNGDKVDQMLTHGGPPEYWCRDYKRSVRKGTTDDFIENVIDECKMHLEDEKGQKLRAQREIVSSFFNSINETKYYSDNNSKFENLALAYNRVEKAFGDSLDSLADLSCSVIEGNDEGNLNFDIGLTAEEIKERKYALSHLIYEWIRVDWDENRRKKLSNAISSAGSLICNNVNASDKSYTDGAALLYEVLKEKTNGEKTSLDQLKEQVCDGFNHRLNFKNITIADNNYQDTFYKLIDWSSDQPKFKNTVVDKKQALTDFIDGAITENEVYGCSAVKLKQQKDYFNNADENSLDNTLNWFAWSLKEAREYHELNQILIPETNNLVDLENLATNLAQFALDNFKNRGWLLMNICENVELSTLSLNYEGSALNGLSCGQNLPNVLLNQNTYCTDCTTLPEYKGDNKSISDKINGLAMLIISEKAKNDFKHDKDFQDKKRAIAKNSLCLPDAIVSDKIIKNDKGLSFKIVLRSPLERVFKGSIVPDMNKKFRIIENRLTKVNTMTGKKCHYGERSGLINSSFELNSENPVIKGLFIQGHINTCLKKEKGQDKGQDKKMSYLRVKSVYGTLKE